MYTVDTAGNVAAVLRRMTPDTLCSQCFVLYNLRRRKFDITNPNAEIVFALAMLKASISVGDLGHVLSINPQGIAETIQEYASAFKPKSIIPQMSALISHQTSSERWLTSEALKDLLFQVALGFAFDKQTQPPGNAEEDFALRNDETGQAVYTFLRNARDQFGDLWQPGTDPTSFFVNRPNQPVLPVMPGRIIDDLMDID